VRRIWYALHKALSEDSSLLVSRDLLLLIRCGGNVSTTVSNKSAAVDVRLPWVDVLVHVVDLLEGKSLGLRKRKSAIRIKVSKTVRKGETYLGHAEVGEDEAACTSGSPDEKHLDFQAGGARLVVDEVGS
jgi:hypothetical protein